MFNQLIPALEAINYHKVKEDKAIIFYESSTAPTVVKLDYTNNNVSFTVTDTSIIVNSFYQ